jgi:hypothetical protein
MWARGQLAAYEYVARGSQCEGSSRKPVMDYIFPDEHLIRFDYWRSVMYAHIERWLQTQVPQGEGVEFGGSNGIIQGFCPNVHWENRDYPAYDILDPASWDREWDLVVLDQILEHTERPWEIFEHLGRCVRGVAIITVPFLIPIHGCPADYWRLTPATLQSLASRHFSTVHLNSWGSTLAAWWLQVYRETATLMENVPEDIWRSCLTDNDPTKPVVIWSLTRK